MEKNNYILNIEEFSLYLQAEKIFSEGTILLYKTVLERFFQFCSQNQNELVLPKTWRYSDIRVRDLEAFLATDKKENQRYHETQVTYLSGIRSFFRYLVEKNFIETNPFQHYVLSRGFREMILIDDAISEIKKDLEVFQVKYDNWFNESSLYEKGLIQKSIKNLKHNEVEKKDGALWFKSTNYGDEKDRVLIRDNEEPTYFASDIAYHKNKYDRDFDEIINIWGADHHGYIPRVKASIESLGLEAKKLKTLLIQFVSLKEKGQKVQMSTRSGEFVELSDLVDEVGIDSARYYFLARKPEQALEFDIDLAKKTNKDNHVYYIQYAHARICSLKKELKKRKIDFNLKESLEKLSLLKETEKEIISLVNGYPEILEQCYKNNELHPLCFYLRDLSSKFHSFYNSEKIISDDKDYSDAKIALSIAIKEIINNGLNILGISCPEKM